MTQWRCIGRGHGMPCPYEEGEKLLPFVFVLFFPLFLITQD